MSEDPSFLLDVIVGSSSSSSSSSDEQRRPLPQSLPEKLHSSTSMPSSLPPMPSILPPSPPKLSMTSYQSSTHIIPTYPIMTERTTNNSKFKKISKKKKNRLNYCMNVPFFFQTPFINSSKNTNKNTYMTTTDNEEEESEEEDDNHSGGNFSHHRYNNNNNVSTTTWVEENYGITNLNSLYRNPNRGLGNSAHGEGTTIHELVFKLRIFHWILSFFGITTQFYTWLGNTFTLHPGRMILGAYNLFFFLVLVGLELHIPWIDRFLKRNFGFLFVSTGRCILLFLMGTLSIGQGSLPMAIIGLCSNALGIYVLYLLYTFPAMDTAFANEGQEEDEDTNTIAKKAKAKVTKYAWSSLTVPEERASLLSSLTKTYI